MPSGVLGVMIATAASWSISVARSRGLPSILTAIAALARPGPIAAANSAPVNGAGNSRGLPSGRVTATDRPGGGGAVIIRSEFSLTAPYAPSLAPFGRGGMVTKKPRPSSGGVPLVQALLLDQRARPPDTPPCGMVVVVMPVRSDPFIARNI